MRQGRFLAPGAVEGVRAGIYHCVSRVVDRRFVLKKREKEQFVRLMRLYEAFCGVRVLAFVVMSNHFHILLEVPPRPAAGLSDREFFARLSLLYSEMHVEEVREQIRVRLNAKDQVGVDALKEKYLYRMWNLSEFMKTLKQRFTQWFNKRHGRRGTLWEDRFKSVIVQDGYAARVMAAYIDLNPVRAGIVKRPEEYRWCSYAEALAGKEFARIGIERLMSKFDQFGTGRQQASSWRKVIEHYRVILFTDGEERLGEDERTQKVKVARRGISAKEAENVRAKAGKLSQKEMLRVRVRHFVDGTAIGMEDFLDEVFREASDRFGSRRKSGARKIRGCNTNLRALRDLREGVG
ncbi:MAG: transposase [Roseibacillus sp.]